MTQGELIKHIHRRTAQVSVGSSAIRNQGASGLIKKCRDYFEKSVDLEEFRQKLTAEKYLTYLDDCTNELVDLFPKGGKSWGAARKALNLFFRDVIYNKYLADFLNIPTGFENNLKTIKHLEVPLDREVASGLIEKFPELPAWKTIKALKVTESKIFQDKATEYADRQGIARVHLDLEFWRRER